jgi:hypothetical protein
VCNGTVTLSPVKISTVGGGVDAHRKRHLNQDYLTCGNKREGHMAAALT